MVPVTQDLVAEGLDEAGFSGAGYARDAYADGAAGKGQERIDEVGGLDAVVGTGGFHQGDAARQGAPIAGADGSGEINVGGSHGRGL